MFGIGFWELVAIGIIALIFVGPQDLPKLARNLGRLLNELKRGSDQFVNEIKGSADWEQTQKQVQSTHDQLSHFSSKITATVGDSSTALSKGANGAKQPSAVESISSAVEINSPSTPQKSSP